MAKLPKKFIDKKVLDGEPLPDWFVNELVDPVNELIEKLGLKFRLNDFTDKAKEEFYKSLQEDCSRKQSLSIGRYAAALKETVIAKYRALSRLGDSEALGLDVENGMMYKMEHDESENPFERLKALFS